MLTEKPQKRQYREMLTKKNPSTIIRLMAVETLGKSDGFIDNSVVETFITSEQSAQVAELERDIRFLNGISAVAFVGTLAAGLRGAYTFWIERGGFDYDASNLYWASALVGLTGFALAGIQEYRAARIREEALPQQMDLNLSIKNGNTIIDGVPYQEVR